MNGKKQNIDIVFVALTMREVEFYANVAEIIKSKGQTVGFIVFFEPGVQFLQGKGNTVFNVAAEVNKGGYKNVNDKTVKEYEARYQIDVRKSILHEKVTLSRFDENHLIQKLFTYLDYMENLIDNYEIGIIVQELGGFISILAAFYCAKRNRLSHIFLEPSLFTGRLLFNLNELNVEIEPAEGVPGQVLKDYLAEYRKSKTVVIPDKDRHHFKDATVSKLVNKENARKLFNKLWFKYIKRQNQEFDAILNHVSRFSRMVINRKRLAKEYVLQEDVSGINNYIYYPLHVPLDFQLTVRTNEYLNQIALLEYVANILPYGIYLFVKEHPAQIGAYTKSELGRLLKSQNVRLLHPRINSYDIVKNAKAVLTINSKVGAEAIMQLKHVIVLGEAFYRGMGVTKDLNSVKELYDHFLFLREREDDFPLAEDEVLRFLNSVYHNTLPGELYNNSNENVNDFTESLMSKIRSID